MNWRKVLFGKQKELTAYERLLNGIIGRSFMLPMYVFLFAFMIIVYYTPDLQQKITLPTMTMMAATFVGIILIERIGELADHFTAWRRMKRQGAHLV